MNSAQAMRGASSMATLTKAPDGFGKVIALVTADAVTVAHVRYGIAG